MERKYILMFFQLQLEFDVSKPMLQNFGMDFEERGGN